MNRRDLFRAVAGALATVFWPLRVAIPHQWSFLKCKWVDCLGGKMIDGRCERCGRAHPTEKPRYGIPFWIQKDGK